MIEGVFPKDELDALFDMALIFSGNAIVHLKDDVKEIKDVVVGDELLGWRGEYRKVKCVYRPKYFKPVMLRYGIGTEIVTIDKDYSAYVEIGEQTKVGARNCFPLHDPVPSPKKARELSIHVDSVEVCNVYKDGGGKYSPGNILKLTQKNCTYVLPYLIGIEGNYLVVNNIVVIGCDTEKINVLIEKENNYYEQRIKKEARANAFEDKRLREDPDSEESNFD